MKKKFYLILLYIFISNIYTFSQITLEKKIAQMIMVGFSGSTLNDSLKYDLNIFGLGGVILFAANIKSPVQIQQLISQIKSQCSIPPFISVDQEGGFVARFNQNNGYERTTTALRIGTQIDNTDSTKAWAIKMANWLSQAGVNIDFAPVVDVNVNPQSPAIGAYERSFSANPNKVFEHSKIFIEEFQKQKILVSLKHFPGHGSSVQDSHNGFTDITNTWSDSELVPFRKHFENNFGKNNFVMIGHLFNAKIDSIYPASLSYNTITGLLKNQMGYDGLIITDALFMKAISDNYSFDKTVELAINAGCDILLYSSNFKDGWSVVDSVIKIVKQKISLGLISEQRINQSYKNIMDAKQVISNISVISELPLEFELKQNYPNPFNPNTTIKYTSPIACRISLKIYDILGREIETLVNKELQRGNYSVEFNASSFSAGIYFYELRAGGNYSVKKMILLK